MKSLRNILFLFVFCFQSYNFFSKSLSCSVMFISNTRQYSPLMYMVKQVDVITVKVPSELKKQMKQVKVNWSQYIRECVQKKIDQEKMRAASEKLDEIRKRSKPVSEEELLSWIREGRERSAGIT
jgi:post-segregation antitoxin (ccd killing protein)